MAPTRLYVIASILHVGFAIVHDLKEKCPSHKITNQIACYPQAMTIDKQAHTVGLQILVLERIFREGKSEISLLY